MKKFRFTITALIPLSQGKNQDLINIEFFTENQETAELFRDEINDLYSKSLNVLRPDPPFPRNENLIEITNENSFPNI